MRKIWYLPVFTKDNIDPSQMVFWDKCKCATLTASGEPLLYRYLSKTPNYSSETVVGYYMIDADRIDLSDAAANTTSGRVPTTRGFQAFEIRSYLVLSNNEIIPNPFHLENNLQPNQTDNQERRGALTR